MFSQCGGMRGPEYQIFPTQAFATSSTIPVFDDSTGDMASDLKHRLCGRIFAADEDQAADDVYPTAATAISVCSKFF